MAKIKTTYTCSECGWTSPKWLGQCRQCEGWGTLEAGTTGVSVSSPGPTVSAPSIPALPVSDVSVSQSKALPSGISEVDRVLGAGITPGAVILLAGEPGVGKSTLLLDIAARYSRMAQARGAGPVLYVTGEESTSQVRLRADRIGAVTPGLLLAAENDLSRILGHIAEHSPSLIIVDSVQTVSVAGVDGHPGGVTQVKAVTTGLIQAAKETHTPTIVVGHVTKDGSLAGPRTLEHLVDVICQFTGDRHTSLRLLRTVKNRYGATDEVGCFRLTDLGIEEVPDPSELFISAAAADAFGSCITMTMEGQRPLSTEIQALVTEGGGGSGRRTVSGVESSRVSMILAVLQAHLELDTRQFDVYVSTVGGARATEPATDLAIALSVISAAHQRPLPPRLLALGEIGLTGDVRAITGLHRRLQEASRLGFNTAIVPAIQASDLPKYAGLQVLPVQNIAEAGTLSLARGTV